MFSIVNNLAQMTDFLQIGRLMIRIDWMWHKMIRIHNMTKYPKSSKWQRKNVPNWRWQSYSLEKKVKVPIWKVERTSQNFFPPPRSTGQSFSNKVVRWPFLSIEYYTLPGLGQLGIRVYEFLGPFYNYF